MFYRHNKTFWYQFCNSKHFLKAENSEDSLASLSCNLQSCTKLVGTHTLLIIIAIIIKMYVYKMTCMIQYRYHDFPNTEFSYFLTIDTRQ